MKGRRVLNRQDIGVIRDPISMDRAASYSRMSVITVGEFLTEKNTVIRHDELADGIHSRDESASAHVSGALAWQQPDAA